MKTTPRLLSLAALAAIFSFASSVKATELVINGGFETGDFTGWTQFGSLAAHFVGTGGFQHSGTYGAVFGVGPTGGIFQNLSTTAGSTYDLTFWLENPRPGSNSFEVQWGGVTIPGSILVDSSDFPYTQFTFTGLPATAASTELRFVFGNDASSWFIDDISVKAASVPESLSGLWLALPLAGMIGFKRLHRHA
jgi:hypothetical protein